jgi:hypothetical protein
LKKKYDHKKNEVLKKKNNLLNEKKEFVSELEHNLKLYFTEYESLDSKKESDRKSLISGLSRKILTYRNSNQKNRKINSPSYFKENPIKLLEERI